jgi:hypothetical protein
MDFTVSFTNDSAWSGFLKSWLHTFSINTKAQVGIFIVLFGGLSSALATESDGSSLKTRPSVRLSRARKPQKPILRTENASQPGRPRAILTGHVSILSEHKALTGFSTLDHRLVADGLLFFLLLFRSRTSLSAEVLFLRKLLAFYGERQVQPGRLDDSARFSFILWSRLCDWKEALVIVKPETLIGCHRKGFQLFWKGKSQAGRPRISENIRKLIVQMAQENPT